MSKLSQRLAAAERDRISLSLQNAGRVDNPSASTHVPNDILDAFFSRRKLDGVGQQKEVFYKANSLLVDAAQSGVKQLISNPDTMDVAYRVEYDATSKNLLGVGEGGRENWEGAKLLVINSTVSWRVPGSEKVRGSVVLPCTTTVYPPKLNDKNSIPELHPTTAVGGYVPALPQDCPEGFDIPDLVYNSVGLEDAFKHVPASKGAVVVSATDSGGSCLNQQHHLGSFILQKLPNVVFWSLRCRVHQGPLAAKAATEFFLNAVGLNAESWQKKIHLAVRILFFVIKWEVVRSSYNGLTFCRPASGFD